MKIYGVCLMVCAILSLSGCSGCEPKVEYVQVPYEVKVPVKCVAPQVECDFNRSTDTEVVGAMLECIADMKRSNDVCR